MAEKPTENASSEKSDENLSDEEKDLRNFENILLAKKSLAKSLKTRDFRLMFVMFLTQLVAGLVLVSRLSNMVCLFKIFGGISSEIVAQHIPKFLSVFSFF